MGKSTTKLHLGKDYTGRLDLYLDPQTLLRHAAIVGASGSGKTVLAKVILEEAALSGIPVIAVDPQGDLASLALPGGDSSFHDKVEVVIWSPGSSCGIQIATDPMRAHKTRDKSVAGLVATTIAGLCGYSLRKPTGVSVAGILSVLLRDKRARSFSRLVQLVEAAAEGKWTNFTKPTASSIQRMAMGGVLRDLLSRLASLEHGHRSDILFEGRQLDIGSMLKAGTKKTRINVVYLNGLVSQEDKAFFVAQLTMQLHQWMMKHPSKKLQALYYIDEIAPYLPSGTSKPAAKEVLQLMLRQARKYGIGCLLATQSPGDVDYRSLSQITTWYLGRIRMKREREKVADVIRANAPDHVEMIHQEMTKMPIGRFFEISNSAVRGIRAKWLRTAHETLTEEEIEDIKQPRLQLRTPRPLTPLQINDNPPPPIPRSKLPPFIDKKAGQTTTAGVHRQQMVYLITSNSREYTRLEDRHYAIEEGLYRARQKRNR